MTFRSVSWTRSKTCLSCELSEHLNCDRGTCRCFCNDEVKISFNECDHDWVRKRKGGDPKCIESYQYVTVCERCGDESDEEFS